MFKMSDVGTLSVFRRPRGAAVTDHHREGGTPTNANGLHKDAASSNHDLARLSHYCIARGRARGRSIGDSTKKELLRCQSRESLSWRAPAQFHSSSTVPHPSPICRLVTCQTVSELWYSAFRLRPATHSSYLHAFITSCFFSR